MFRPVEFFLVLCAGTSPFPAGNRGRGGKNGQKSAKPRKSSLIVREPRVPVRAPGVCIPKKPNKQTKKKTVERGEKGKKKKKKKKGK